MKSIFFIALSALLASHLFGQTGTVKDPYPSDRQISAMGGQTRDEKFWRLLPSNEQKAAGIVRFIFRFQTYDAPDSFDIYYGKDHIYTTNGLVTIPYDNATQSDTKTVNLEVALRKSLLIRVVVNKKGNTQNPNTAWRYSIQSRLAALYDGLDASDANNTEIKEDGIAYITSDSPPTMPNLYAKVRFPDPKSKVRWRLVVKYGPQVIKIPANGRFTSPASASTPWDIYQNYVNAKGNDLGLFGGQATLYFKVDNTRVDTLDFTLGGQNPDDSTVRSYIDSLTSSPFVYAVAKAETLGYCGEDSLYNQFYDQNSVVGINPQKQSGFPVRAAVKGYGMYQLAKLSKVTRAQKWNWQANIQEGVRRLTTSTVPTPAVSAATTPAPAVPTAVDVANTLLQDLQRTYPDAEPLPSVSYSVGTGTQSVSGIDATTLTAYDGFAGCPYLKVTTASGGSKMRKSCWIYDATQDPGQRWIFQPNKRNFVEQVVKQIEPQN